MEPGARCVAGGSEKLRQEERSQGTLRITTLPGPRPCCKRAQQNPWELPWARGCKRWETRSLVLPCLPAALEAKGSLGRAGTAPAGTPCPLGGTLPGCTAPGATGIWGGKEQELWGAQSCEETACTPRNSAEVDQGPCGCSAVPLPPGSLQEPPPELCQRGVSSQPPGSCSSSSLSGLLCSNREQTPFMRPRRCFLPGLGPEEGDVTTMQTDDGSRHLGRGRAADPRQGAQPRVCEGVLAAGGPPAGTSLALGEELWSTTLI